MHENKYEVGKDRYRNELFTSVDNREVTFRVSVLHQLMNRQSNKGIGHSLTFCLRESVYFGMSKTAHLKTCNQATQLEIHYIIISKLAINVQR